MEAERIAPLDYWSDAEEDSDDADFSGGAATRTATVPLGVSLATVTYGADVASSEQATTAYRARWKRALDVALAGPLFLATAPLVFALAIVVGVTSGWPVFYAARRVGRNGKEFRMWKLRTMVRDADRIIEEWQVSNPELAEQYFADFKLEEDPRITSVGRFLRKSSLDELPQLWNVLRGDMSLVGPRPVVREELSHYGANVEDLLAVRPGVTGFWQTEGRNEIRYPERSWFELTYCRTYDLTMDMKILLRTLRCPVRFDG